MSGTQSGNTINLNIAPYYDDFDELKNFYMVLFKPGVSVQARELTQAQSILQDQISKFGRQIYTSGTIVQGCALSFDSNYDYVKINDAYTNNAIITVSNLQGATCTNPNGLIASVVNTLSGYQSNFNANNAANSILNTLYIKYLNSATFANGVQQQVFAAGDIITVQNPTNNTIIGLITVANSATIPTGTGYAATIADGVVFQDDTFVRVDPQTAVVQNYFNAPDNISLGFAITESIITSDIDSSLLDNATGSPSYFSPGADRLKLVANLVTVTTSSISNSSGFFSICNFVSGTPSIVNTATQYSSLGRSIAQQNYEETGNFVITPFPVSVNEISGNNTYNQVTIGKGLGYISGYRTQIVGNINTPIRKGTDFANVSSEYISVSFGNYVEIDEYSGSFDPTGLTQVELHISARQSVTNRTFLGTTRLTTDIIGYAFVKGVAFDSGESGTPTGTFRLYLMNIQMLPGYNFNQVQSVMSYNGSLLGVADLLLTNSLPTLLETNLNKLVYSAGPTALKQVANSNFIYRGKISNSTFTSSGQLVINASPSVLPYGGYLSSAEEVDFIVVSGANFQTVNKTGTVSVNTSNTAVVGTGTTFTTDYTVGDYILTDSSNDIRRIINIFSATSLVVDAPFSQTVSGITHCKIFPAGMVIPFQNNANRTIFVNGGSATFSLNETFTSGAAATVYFNAAQDNTPGLSKIVKQNVYVNINCSNNAGGYTGPWCLGVPDVYSIAHVYVGTGYSTTTDMANNFILDNGQRDSYYGLSNLSLSPTNTIHLAPNTTIVVVLNSFSYSNSAGKGFFTINSYPIDDANTANVNAIETPQIPVYISPVDGSSTDLRDAIDFRPVAVATASLANSSGNATINPNSAITFSGNNNFVVAPDSVFQTNLEYYLGRIDLVTMNSRAQLQVVEGSPNTNPITPTGISKTSTLATVSVPPYPSLSSNLASFYDRYDYAVSVTPTQNRRYTMQDIGVLDSRISTLEYYTSLSLLETSANNMLITSNTTGANRFKNGFLVDTFANFGVSDTTDPTFNIAIDAGASQMRPAFTVNAFDLKLNTTASNNVINVGEITIMDYDDVAYITQPYASQYRNCIQSNLFDWVGAMTISPSADVTPDYTSDPPVVANIDDASNWINLANSWGTQWDAWQDVSTVSSSSNSVVANSTQSSTYTTTATSTTQSQTGQSLVVTGITNSTQTLGTFVTSIGVSPYVRANPVNFFASGMKPSTAIFAYFNDTPVSQYCYPANSASTDVNDNYTQTGAIGSQLMTDASGTVCGVFMIPSATFNVGTLTFTLNDVADLTTGSNDITTAATATYVADNISASTATVELNTREATVAMQSTSQTRVVTTDTTSLTGVSIISSPTASSNQVPIYSTYSDSNGTTYWGLDGTNGGTTGSNVGYTGYYGTYETETAQGVDPIGQTFVIAEPTGGVSGVFVTSVDVYFATADTTQGVHIQIRTVDNGYPTQNIVPFGEVIYPASAINTSSDASVATTFVFDSPLFLQTNQTYFLCVMPIANNPNYAVWTGVISATDVLTNTPIYSNMSTGVLFVSSTNETWTPYQNEAMKFTVYRADFPTGIGSIVLNNNDYEFLKYDVMKKSFILGEPVYLSNTFSSTGLLTTSNTTGTFSNGQAVTQTIPSGNASATIYNISGNVLKVNNISGQFIAGLPVVSTSASANVTATFINATTIIGNNIITVPDSSVYVTNTMIFVTSNTQTNTIISSVVAVNATTNQLTLANAVTWSDNYAAIGTIRGNGTLTSTISQITSNNQIILDNSTANSSINFASPKGQLLIGTLSGAVANIQGIYDQPYDTVAPMLQTLIPVGTTLSANFIGVSNTLVVDTSPFTLNLSNDNNFIDKERILMSKSNEQTKLSPITKSVTLNVNVATANSKISPYVDEIEQNVTLVHNLIVPETSLSGYSLTVSNTSATFNIGDAVSVGSSNGYVLTSNSSYIRLNLTSGTFASNTILLNTTQGNTVNAYINSAQVFSEETGVVYAPSRYISQKVVLVSGQEAEDLVVYLTAYRPANTDLIVYCKLLNYQDSATFASTTWTQMIANSATTNLFSSLSDPTDLIDIDYELPSSYVAQNSLVATSNASANITVASVAAMAAVAVGGEYVYIKNLTTGEFNVSSINYIANNTTVVLNNIPTFTTANAEFGVIPGLTNIHSAFKYSDNSGIVRYVSNSNITFDTYNTFAIKIVPVATSPNIVPTVKDMQAIALQI